MTNPDKQINFHLSEDIILAYWPEKIKLHSQNSYQYNLTLSICFYLGTSLKPHTSYVKRDNKWGVYTTGNTNIGWNVVSVQLKV